ncbi:DUF1992 domain-containing protein [Peribacillus asahii]|uniref:DnaJ family domain-containing protein n=1 Tax=Peribacillus asahii TaxID=228899 RepID=UPI00207AAEE2|nr:DUF1992 domain-containing protein [Peribacillus asahii]USK68851.1 DUF1992 domain-containing protein [Peribacillus asahii]
MDFVHIIAEEKIKQAMNNGEFDHLPGKGKPLVIEDLSAIPQDLRMAYSLLKNAKMLEDEQNYRKELMQIEDLIACCHAPEEKLVLQQKLNQKLLQFNQVLQKRNTTNSNAFKKYDTKIQMRIRKN